VLRDPETWERFDEVIVTHSVREVGDLAYRQFLSQDIFDDPLVGDLACGRLFYYPTNPVMLYSIGKDSSVMLHLAMKAFYPAKPPFPFLHVDTTGNSRR
jgi:ferredoxin-NADP reductase